MNIDSQSILHVYKLPVPKNMEEANRVLSVTPFKKTDRKFDRVAVRYWWTNVFNSLTPTEVKDSWLVASKDIFRFCRPDEKAILDGILHMAIYISQQENVKKQANQIKTWVPLVNDKRFRIYTHATRDDRWYLLIKPKFECEIFVEDRLHKAFSKFSRAINYIHRQLWYRIPRNTRLNGGQRNSGEDEFISAIRRANNTFGAGTRQRAGRVFSSMNLNDYIQQPINVPSSEPQDTPF